MTPELKSEQFFYDPGVRRFSASASKLGFKPGFIPYEIKLSIGEPGKIESFVLEFIDKDGNVVFLANGPLNALGVEMKIFNN